MTHAPRRIWPECRSRRAARACAQVARDRRRARARRKALTRSSTSTTGPTTSQPTVIAGLREGDRHQGQLRRLRLQRGAARPSCSPATPATTSSCRRRLPRAADQGRRVPEARQVAAAEPEERRPGDRAATWRCYDPGNEYAVDYMWGTSGIGYNADKIKAPHAGRAGRQLAHGVRPGRGLQVCQDCGVSVLDAPAEVVATVLLYLGRDPNSEAGGPQGRRAGADGDPALHPLYRLLALHRRSRQRRDLPRARLVGRHHAGARPRQGGRQGHRHQLHDPEGRRDHLLRHAGHPGGCAAPAERAPVHRLPAAPGGRGAELATLIKYANGNSAVAAAARPGGAQRPGRLSAAGDAARS